jgi:CHAT domain-containing protein
LDLFPPLWQGNIPRDLATEQAGHCSKRQRTQKTTYDPEEEETMSSKSTELLKQLDIADSREEGLALLMANLSNLTLTLADSLSARAHQLQSAGETVLSEDFSAWATEARALTTRFAATKLEGDQAANEYLSTHKNRFDDAFFDLNFRLASGKLNRIYGYLTLTQSAKSEAALIVEALGAAWQEVGFLIAISEIVGNPLYRDKSKFLLGTLFLFRSEWEKQQSMIKEAGETAAQATYLLRAAAGSKILPAELRALAEIRLAALAGETNPDEASRHQEAAMAIAEAEQAGDIVASIQRDRAYWAKKHHDWPAAVALYRQNIELGEKQIRAASTPGMIASLVAQTQPDYEGAVDACLKAGKTDPAFYDQALENAEYGKARAFLRSLGTANASPQDVQQLLHERHSRILQQMSDAKADSSKEAPRLAHALAAVEDQLWVQAQDCTQDAPCIPGTFAQIQTLVPQEGAILSYFTFADRVIAFVLGEEGLIAPPVEIPVAERELARWKIEMLTAIRARSRYQTMDEMQQKMETTGNALNAPLYLQHFYIVLLQPVIAALAGKKQIVILPHGVLNGLPFHAFSDGAGHTLLDDAAVSYAPGAAVLQWCRNHRRNETATCFAAGSNGTQEAAAVAQAFGCAPAEAKRSAFLASAGQCDVVHLSCPGDIKARFSAFSGLQMEDGALSQREIAAMPCQSALVTLSASETAQADTQAHSGKDFAGLIGAFFHAGCPSVAASLWPVDAAVAEPFFKAFYANLKKDGMSKAEALRQAQLAIKAQAQDGYDHAYFWAPLVLWGSN